MAIYFLRLALENNFLLISLHKFSVIIFVAHHFRFHSSRYYSTHFVVTQKRDNALCNVCIHPLG